MPAEQLYKEGHQSHTERSTVHITVNIS